MIQTENRAADLKTFSFRKGQPDALRAITDFLESHQQSSYILATGSFGKTVLYIKAVQAYRKLMPDNNRVLVLAESVNLLGQLEREFRSFAPELSVARACRQNPFPEADVVLASLQRCRNFHSAEVLHRLLRPFVIVDEAHTLLGDQTQEMTRFILQQGSRILGGTATDEYFSDKKLSQLLGDPCYRLSYNEARELGVVAPFTTGAISLPFNMSKVHKIGSDYDAAALAVVFPAEQCAEAISRYHTDYCSGKKGFVQCLSREHAKRTAEILRKNGIRAAAITGDLSEDVREREIDRAKHGELEILCGAKLLIQGIDWPEASVAYNFPSASALAVKQRGFRVTRLDPNNPNKCATIVEILPIAISKTKPPIIFREAISGGILPHGVGSRKHGVPITSRGASTPHSADLLPDQDSALAIIDEVLRGSGPWARLQRQVPEPAKLKGVVAELGGSIREFLDDLVTRPRLKETLETLGLESMREHRDSHLPPRLAPKVIDAIAILSDSKRDPIARDKALGRIQRFLFAPPQYSASTDSVSALGLVPAQLVKLLPKCLGPDRATIVSHIAARSDAHALLSDLIFEVAGTVNAEPPMKAKIPSEVLIALDRLSDASCTAEQRDASTKALGRFLFSDLTFNPSTRILKSLGFTPETLYLRLNETLPPSVPEEMRALLNTMSECGHFLAASFEPLIECEATLQGIKDSPAFEHADWHSQGAETLIHSIYLHDESVRNRFQTYLQNKIARKFRGLIESARRVEQNNSERRVEFISPDELNTFSTQAMPTELRVFLDAWYEQAAEILKNYASSALTYGRRRTRVELVQAYLRELKGEESVKITNIARECRVTHEIIRRELEEMRTRLHRSLASSYDDLRGDHQLTDSHCESESIFDQLAPHTQSGTSE